MLLNAPCAFDPPGRVPGEASGWTTVECVTLVMFRILVMFVMFVTLTTLKLLPNPNHGKNGSHGPTGNQPSEPNPKPKPKPEEKCLPNPNPTKLTHAGDQTGTNDPVKNPANHPQLPPQNTHRPQC